jgi:predicted nucleotidyltransferase
MGVWRSAAVTARQTALVTRPSPSHAPVVTVESPEVVGAALFRALEPRAEVLEAYLFGSAASGRTSTHSDVDVAVYVDPAALGAAESGYGYAAELSAYLMSALGENAVDLVVLNHASPLLYHRVLSGGVRLLARDLRAATVREGRALSRYCDYLPQLEKIRAATARRFDAGRFGR